MEQSPHTPTPTQIAHKTRLTVTPEQEAILLDCLRAARFTYNWTLAQLNETQSVRLAALRAKRTELTESGMDEGAAARAATKWLKQQDDLPSTPSMYTLKKQFNAIKADEFPKEASGDPGYGWLYNASSRARECGFMRANAAVQRYFGIVTGKIARPKNS